MRADFRVALRSGVLLHMQDMDPMRTVSRRYEHEALNWSQGWRLCCIGPSKSEPQKNILSAHVCSTFPIVISFPIFTMTSLLSILTDGNLLSLSTKAGALIAAYWLIWMVYSRTLHPLAKVPGPVWPSLSRTWLMYRMYLGDYQVVQVELHKKYTTRSRMYYCI